MSFRRSMFLLGEGGGGLGVMQIEGAYVCYTIYSLAVKKKHASAFSSLEAFYSLTVLVRTSIKTNFIAQFQ